MIRDFFSVNLRVQCACKSENCHLLHLSGARTLLLFKTFVPVFVGAFISERCKLENRKILTKKQSLFTMPKTDCQLEGESQNLRLGYIS